MKKLAFFLGLAIAIFVSAQFASATQVINDTLQVNSLKVGQQGMGGVTYFNGTIINETTGEDGADNPVAFGDNVRIDGRLYRGATAGASDSLPLIVNDNMEVVGSLTADSLIIGSTNILTSLNALGTGDMLKSTYDAAGNSKIDADKLDSGIAATLLGTGTISNTEFGYLNGVTSAIQTQLNAKGVGDMLQSIYDTDANSMIDTSRLDSGIAATLIGAATISNTEFGYLNGVTSAIQTQLNAKGVGDMLKSTYDVAGNSKIDAGKLDSGINATLIGGGGVSNTLFGYLASLNLDNTSDLKLTALGYEAANSLTGVGYRNTLIGFQAGDGITDGTDNTALGNGTLGAAATSSQNTAIGANTLAANTDANNTAVGYNALAANVGGSEVTAVGSGALDANNSGNYNTAVGYNALGANTSGVNNTAVGHSALAVQSGTATNNTAVGYLALDVNDNGIFNNAFGSGALGGVIGGSYNIGIGRYAGNNITSGQSNIIIGDDIDAPSATLNNQLNIGGSIYGDLNNDYIGIGDYSSTVPGDAMLSILQTGTVPHIELNPVGSAPTTDVTEGDIYMNTDGILYIRNNSTWAAANAAGDFSELIVPLGFKKEMPDSVRPYVGDIQAGDVIIIDANGNYARSNKSYDAAIVGIESGNRGQFYLHEGTPERAEGQRQVGIVGHILVNITLENGSIKPGDSLTTSSLPGHAMKSTMPGTIIGKALEPLDGSKGRTGQIEVLVNPGWYGGVMCI